MGGLAGAGGHTVVKNVTKWGDDIVGGVRRVNGDFHRMADSTEAMAKKMNTIADNSDSVIRKARDNRFFGVFSKKSSAEMPGPPGQQNSSGVFNSRSFVTGLTGVGLGRLAHWLVDDEVRNAKIRKSNTLRTQVSKATSPTLKRKLQMAARAAGRHNRLRALPWAMTGGALAIGADQLLQRKSKSPEFSPYWNPSMPAAMPVRKRRETREERFAPIFSTPIKHADLVEAKKPKEEAKSEQAAPKLLTGKKIKAMTASATLADVHPLRDVLNMDL